MVIATCTNNDSLNWTRVECKLNRGHYFMWWWTRLYMWRHACASSKKLEEFKADCSATFSRGSTAEKSSAYTESWSPDQLRLKTFQTEFDSLISDRALHDARYFHPSVLLQPPGMHISFLFHDFSMCDLAHHMVSLHAPALTDSFHKSWLLCDVCLESVIFTSLDFPATFAPNASSAFISPILVHVISYQCTKRVSEPLPTSGTRSWWEACEHVPWSLLVAVTFFKDWFADTCMFSPSSSTKHWMSSKVSVWPKSCQQSFFKWSRTTLCNYRLSKRLCPMLYRWSSFKRPWSWTIPCNIRPSGDLHNSITFSMSDSSATYQ